MIARFLLLISSLILSGCGEAERPRFTPATADAPASSTPKGRPDWGGATPQKIQMH